MKCVYCGKHIKGTGRYNPKEMGFERLYWDEWVDSIVHSNCCSVTHLNKQGFNLPIVTKEEIIKHCAEIKKFLDTHPKTHGMSGEGYQNSKYYNRFNTSWRGFGSIMSAYMNTKKGKRMYHYCDFYM